MKNATGVLHWLATGKRADEIASGSKRTELVACGLKWEHDKSNFGLGLKIQCYNACGVF